MARPKVMKNSTHCLISQQQQMNTDYEQWLTGRENNAIYSIISINYMHFHNNEPYRKVWHISCSI